MTLLQQFGLVQRAADWVVVKLDDDTSEWNLILEFLSNLFAFPPSDPPEFSITLPGRACRTYDCLESDYRTTYQLPACWSASLWFVLFAAHISGKCES